MGFNSAFKGLTKYPTRESLSHNKVYLADKCIHKVLREPQPEEHRTVYHSFFIPHLTFSGYINQTVLKRQ
jgi:hypothetical protein